MIIMKNKAIDKASRVRLVFTVLFSRRLCKHGFNLFGTILYYFFIIQFQTAWRLKKRTVIKVDHPLDADIPFCPEDAKTYLFFIPLWMKSLAFFRAAGGKAVDTQAIEFMNGLARLYKEAGLIYNKCQSTTNRPKADGRLLFLVIHFFDPHLHCVPSLHVGVVLYNYFMMRKLLPELCRKGIISKEQSEISIAWAKQEALAIIDTILTIKQHSVNCVAAGLFFLNALYPDDYSRKECLTVVDDLLENRKEQIPCLKEIREHIKKLFKEFCASYDKDTVSAKDYKAVMLDFLKNYQFKN